MPTLNKNKRQRVYQQNKQNIGAIYNKYKKVRDAYILEHPLCADCLNPAIINEDMKYGERVTPVDEVHHIVPFLNGANKAEQLKLALDYSNLVGLCKFHHHLRHNNDRKKRKSQ